MNKITRVYIVWLEDTPHQRIWVERDAERRSYAYTYERHTRLCSVLLHSPCSDDPYPGSIVTVWKVRE